MSEKWWDEPFVLSAIQCAYGDSYEDLHNYVAKNAFDGEQLLHLLAQGHMGYYNAQTDAGKLDEYLTESRKLGLRQVVYFNNHCITRPMRDEHPQWVQRNRDGEEMRAYDINFLCCTNVRTDWYQNWFRPNIADLASHDIDGIFLDGPIYTAASCFCEQCAADFMARHGKPIAGATYNELMHFKVDLITENLRETSKIVQGVNPDIMLYINNSALRADVTGSNTRRVEPYVDILGAEGGFIAVDKNTTLWHVSPMAKMLETQAQGKPTIIFIAGDYKPSSYCMHTAQETKLYCAETVANGANIWYGIHGPTPQTATPGGQAALEFFRFFRDHKDLYRNTAPVSKVALLWSQQTANFYASDVAGTDFTAEQKLGWARKGNHSQSFRGFCEVLMREHIQFDVIDEVSLNDGTVSKYDLLILPTAACLSAGDAAAITAYVENGGNLLSSFDTGFYNEEGELLPRPALGKLQGFVSAGNIVDVPAGMGYQRVNEAWLGEGVSWELTPLPSHLIPVVPAGDTQVLSTFGDVMPSRYAPLPENWHPGLLMSRHGKGESVYIPADAGETFHRATNPDWKRMIANCVRRLSAPLLESSAPGSVEIVLRRQGDRYLLHLINKTGEMERPIQRVIPLRDVEISLTLDKPPKTFRAVVSGASGSLQGQETLRLTLPLLKDYEILVLE